METLTQQESLFTLFVPQYSRNEHFGSNPVGSPSFPQVLRSQGAFGEHWRKEFERPFQGERFGGVSVGCQATRRLELHSITLPRAKQNTEG